MPTIVFTLTETKQGLVSTPESAQAIESNTTLQFTLAGSAATDYRITGYNSNDSKEQLGTGSISQDGVTMLVNDANSQPEIININVQIEHRKQGTKHGVDPQVENMPPD
jgi:hypothetical protein